MHGGSAQRYARWLWVLFGLFVIRVVAQPLALRVDSPFLPEFEAWHSGVVAYPLLVFSQLLILAWLARTAWTFSTGQVYPDRRRGVLGLVFGAIYLSMMIVRLALGASVLSDRRWFASPLPTIFHIVLASFLLLYGHFHFRHGSPESGPLTV